MPKFVGTGMSSRVEARKAAEEAARGALRRLGGARPSFGFVFASPDVDLGAAVSEVQRVADCHDILGSSTAGQFTETGRSDGGLVVMLVAADNASHCMEFGRRLKLEHRSIAERFAGAAAEAKIAARAAGRRHLTTVVLTDGLAGTGEELVHQMFEQSTSVAQIVGGAAGDAGRFRETLVAAGQACASDAAAVLHVFDANSWGVGLNHGLRPTTKPMRVTRSQGNVLHAIEGQPAFEAYRRHAHERGVALTRENAPPYMIANELGVHFFSSLSRARAPLSVGDDGSLTCAAPVPEGSFVSILDGEPESMIAAARAAAEEARERLGKAKPAGVLLFDCVCRGMILREAFSSEIDAVRSVFGDVPVAGFLTYGEIAQYAGRLEGWHNATAVVVAIPS
jgi:methyl-accepting chemotaxis protein